MWFCERESDESIPGRYFFRIGFTAGAETQNKPTAISIPDLRNRTVSTAVCRLKTSVEILLLEEPFEEYNFLKAHLSTNNETLGMKCNLPDCYIISCP